MLNTLLIGAVVKSSSKEGKYLDTIENLNKNSKTKKVLESKSSNVGKKFGLELVDILSTLARCKFGVHDSKKETQLNHKMKQSYERKI